jgi:hypothetical protein
MTLADEINRMIEKVLQASTWTSAGGSNPVENFINEPRGFITPDLESEVKGGGDSAAKEQKKFVTLEKKVTKWDKGNIGDVNRFTTQQMGNLRDFVSNPFGFMIKSVFRKFAKGLGVVTFALIIFEAVKWIISELLKPGRLLDIRFKRDIRTEIIAFRRREDQQKLKQGYSNIIITTSPRLRGGQGQVTNTLDLVRNGNFPQGIGQSQIMPIVAGLPISKHKGRGRFSG